MQSFSFSRVDMQISCSPWSMKSSNKVSHRRWSIVSLICLFDRWKGFLIRLNCISRWCEHVFSTVMPIDSCRYCSSRVIDRSVGQSSHFHMNNASSTYRSRWLPIHRIDYRPVPLSLSQSVKKERIISDKTEKSIAWQTSQWEDKPDNTRNKSICSIRRILLLLSLRTSIDMIRFRSVILQWMKSYVIWRSFTDTISPTEHFGDIVAEEREKNSKERRNHEHFTSNLRIKIFSRTHGAVAIVIGRLRPISDNSLVAVPFLDWSNSKRRSHWSLHTALDRIPERP